MSNKKVYSTMGASNHSTREREKNDFYATEPTAVERLLRVEKFSKNILEPCCGSGHISEVLKSHGYIVTSEELFDRGYGNTGLDFLERKNMCGGGTSSLTRHIRIILTS